jgi:hypothetical protein
MPEGVPTVEWSEHVTRTRGQTSRPSSARPALLAREGNVGLLFFLRLTRWTPTHPRLPARRAETAHGGVARSAGVVWFSSSA